jgi:hypothetical protein
MCGWEKKWTPKFGPGAKEWRKNKSAVCGAMNTGGIGQPAGLVVWNSGIFPRFTRF